MKSSAFALFLGLAAQALPATLQLNPPAAASEGPAAIRVGAGGDLQAALDRAKAGDVIELASGAMLHRELRPAREGRQPLHHPEDCADRRPARRDRRASTPPTAASSRGSSRPTARRRCARRPGAHHWRLMLLEFGPNASAVRRHPGARRRHRRRSPATRMPHDLVVDRCYIHGDPGARPEARHRDEQRLDDRHRLVHLRHQVDQPGRAGDRRLERARPVSDREQLSRGIRRELHARRRAAGGERPGAVGSRLPAEPRVAAGRLALRELERQESVRAEERAARARRRQPLREPLGRRAAGLRHRVHPARRGRRRARGRRSRTSPSATTSFATSPPASICWPATTTARAARSAGCASPTT